MKNKGLKYLQISDVIREKIIDGTYKPGEQIPTQKELVTLFSTSRPTIEKAFDVLEQAGFLFRIKGAGTFVCKSIPTEARQNNGQLKLAFFAPRPSLDDFEHTFINLIVSRISNESLQHSFTLVTDTASFENDHTLVDHMKDTCRKFIADKVKGVFFVPVDFAEDSETINQTICETLHQEGIQIILLDRDIFQMPRRSQFDVIGINNRRASFRLTSHLIDLGLEHIYFVSSRLNSNVVRERIEGFTQAMTAANLTAHTFLDYSFEETPHSSQQLKELLNHTPKPQALVCINDKAASILMQDALQLGLKLPDELHIVGFDDLPTSRLLYCPLTTIKQPVEHIASQAVQRMINRITSPVSPAMDIYINEELIIRNS